VIIPLAKYVIDMKSRVRVGADIKSTPGGDKYSTTSDAID
jgi:hypothetical protein